MTIKSEFKLAIFDRKKTGSGDQPQENAKNTKTAASLSAFFVFFVAILCSSSGLRGFARFTMGWWGWGPLRDSADASRCQLTSPFGAYVRLFGAKKSALEAPLNSIASGNNRGSRRPPQLALFFSPASRYIRNRMKRIILTGSFSLGPSIR
jgi:hypothetical protein